MKQPDFITMLTANFQKATGLLIEIDQNPGNKPGDKAVVKNAAIKEHFTIEVRHEIRGLHLPGILAKAGQQKYLLLCREAAPAIKKELQKNGINYIEANGNCYVQTDKLVLRINDNKPLPKQQQGNLWNQTGLKFLFAILREPGLLNNTYRDIANKATIALGSIGGLIKLLTDGGYAQADENGTYTLTNKDRLIEQWATTYETTLRNKLLTGKYRFANTTWANMNIAPGTTADMGGYVNEGQHNIWDDEKAQKDIVWGGEVGAAMLTNGALRPERVTIYTELPANKLLAQLRLIPDANGNVEVLKPIWQIDDTAARHVAPALLIYADMAASFDSRNQQIAQIIKKKHIDQ